MSNHPSQQKAVSGFLTEQRHSFRDLRLAPDQISELAEVKNFSRLYKCKSDHAGHIIAKGESFCELIMRAQMICDYLYGVKLLDPEWAMPQINKMHRTKSDKSFDISIEVLPLFSSVGSASLNPSDVSKSELIIAHCASFVLTGNSIFGLRRVICADGIFSFYPGIGIQKLCRSFSGNNLDCLMLYSRKKSAE